MLQFLGMGKLACNARNVRQTVTPVAEAQVDIDHARVIGKGKCWGALAVLTS